MKIINRKIKDLIHAGYNPRELTPDQHQQLKDSLTGFGMVDPVIVNTHKDRKDIIVGGHQRTKVWLEMGNKEIPTVEVSLTLKKERELNIRLNKNSGQWYEQALTEHFNTEELIEWGFKGEELQSFDKTNLVNSEGDEWIGMPDFETKENALKIIINFENEEDRENFANKYKLKFLQKYSSAWSTWHPYKEQRDRGAVEYQ